MESSEVVEEDTSASCKVGFTSNDFTQEDRSDKYKCQNNSESKLDVDLASEFTAETSQLAPEPLHQLELAPKSVSRHRSKYGKSGGRKLVPRKEESRSHRRNDEYQNTTIKEENGICKECILCAGRSEDTFDVFSDTTCCGQVTLCSYISKVAKVSLHPHVCVTKYACRSCYDLLNVVEQAELEYLKNRDLLLEIIGQNPALGRFDVLESGALPSDLVKVEHCKTENVISSEDDEPLAFMKPSQKTRNKVDYESRDESPVDYRHFSSDEDFYWKVEPKEEQELGLHFTCKKSRIIRAKEPPIKEEIDPKDPSELLLVELQEAVKDDWIFPRKRKKGTKFKNRKKKEHRQERKKRGRKKENEEEKVDLTCIKCNKTFTKKNYYDYHMAKHDNLHLPFICEVCGKGFKNRKICDAHVLMHRGIADFKCIPCNKLFLTKFAFLRHDKIHQGKPKHQCDLCGKSFIHQSSFRMHKLAHAGIKKHSCDVCGLSLISSSHLSRHKRIHSGEKRYECDVCGKKFSEKYNMQSHMRTHMKGREAPPSPVTFPGKRKRWFRCEMCEEKFDRLFKLEIHLVDDHKVVLKKGRPKPRNTMKKLQRAQQAAASMVNAIATAMGAKRAADQMLATVAENVQLDIKPSVSTLNEKMKEASAPSGSVFKTSPHRQSVSPATAYMSPPPGEAGSTNADSVRTDYQEQQVQVSDYHQQVIRSATAVWPHMAYNVGMGYLSRMPDYSQH